MSSKEELIKKLDEEMQANIAYVKPLLETSLFAFNKHILQLEQGKTAVPLAPVHKELCDFIDKNKHKKKLVLIPRGHLKSSVVTVGRTLQAVAQDPTKRILIANATHSLACSFLTEVKRHLKFNEKFKMFWGDLTENAEVWSQNAIKFATAKAKEPNVVAMGVESNMTSQHYDIIILDDVVNADFVNTQDQIQKTIDFYKETLNLLEPNGEVIIIGTRWHDSDLYGWIMDTDNPVISDFEVFIRQAYEGDLFSDEDELELLFPAKFSKAHLRRLYEQLGPYFFATQYQNNPIPADSADFKNTWFKYYDPEYLRGRLLNKFTTVDPAISTEKHADFTAIVTVGVDEFRNVYVLDIVRKRMGPSEIIDTIFNIWSEFKPIKIGLEDVAFQKSLQYSLNEEMHNRGIYLPIQPLKPGGRNKDQRIRGLQPLYANGKVFHGKHVNNMKQLEDELVRFPRSKHDDVVDALAYILDIPVFPPNRRVSKPKSSQRYLYG